MTMVCGVAAIFAFLIAPQWSPAAQPAKKPNGTRGNQSKVDARLRNSEGGLIEAERKLLDASRELLEQKLRILAVDLYSELTLSRPFRRALQGKEMTYTAAEKAFLEKMSQPKTDDERQASDKESKRISWSFSEALTRYVDADLRRSRLVVMLIRDLSPSQLDEYRKKGTPIDADPDVKKILDRHRR